MRQPSRRQGGAVGLVTRNIALLCIVSAAVMLRVLSLGLYPLMDTTEARYAEIARLMIELNDWVTPWFDYGVPFWGKPPLSFWATALSFQALGISEFAARLPHFLAAVAVVWIMWGLALRRSYCLALYASVLLIGSALFFVSAGAVMTDMSMLVGTTLAMRGFWVGLHAGADERGGERYWFFVGLGVGLLAKGPIAIVVSTFPILLWTALTGRGTEVWRRLPWIRGGLVTLTIGLPWYLLAEGRTPGFLDYFLIGEHWSRFLIPGWEGDRYGSAHDFPRGSIWIFLLVGLLPWTVLMPAYYGIRLVRGTAAAKRTVQRDWIVYLCLWALFPAVFFTFAGNILWPYVLPGFPALALLAGGWLESHDRRCVVWMLSLGLITTLCALALFIVDLHASRRSEARSQKALVADYENRKQYGERLVYLGARQFSASFYSSGTAEFIPDMDSLTKRLGDARAYVAILNEQARTVPPQLMLSLTRVNTHGRYTLYYSLHGQARP